MLDFEQLFHNNCIITNGTHKRVDWWEGGRVGGRQVEWEVEGCAAGGGLYFSVDHRHAQQRCVVNK